ncbi:MAG: adenosylcobinamide-GDP ribazoletransferase [Pyramidobacter sp.]|nr:adenosylcobinamide-GDP ribazoletransferase [Pyramidobacter sp.]
MDLVKSFFIALSVYTALPVPQFQWDERPMAFSLCFLPFAGVCVGALTAAWFALASALNFSDFLTAAGAVAAGVLLTGGIHMDGWCDTWDALGSHQPPERCLEIMSDSRSGAFAVIGCCLWVLLDFALYAELMRRGVQNAACFIFVLSRSVCAFLSVTLKGAKKGGMLAAFAAPARRRAVQGASCLWGALAAAGLALYGTALVWASVALVLTTAWYVRLTRRRFGGITGDTSGFFIQMSELAMLAGLVLSAR